MSTKQTTAIQVTVRGDIPDPDRDYAVHKIESVLLLAHAPVLSAHLVLSLDGEHALDHRAHIEIGLDVNGTPIRAKIAAAGVLEAADLVQERLRRRLTHVRDRIRTRARWTNITGEPRRLPTTPPRPRSDSVLRAAENREVVRRKTFAVHAMTVPEAVDEMALLDHDFYLFTDLDTGADEVLCRTSPPSPEQNPADDEYVLLADPPTLTEELARERLEVGGETLVFYRDPGDGRGRVLYQRRHANYGLITPS